MQNHCLFTWKSNETPEKIAGKFRLMSSIFQVSRRSLIIINESSYQHRKVRVDVTSISGVTFKISDTKTTYSKKIHSAEKFGLMSSTFQVSRPKYQPIIQYLWTNTPNKFKCLSPLTSHPKDQVLKIYIVKKIHYGNSKKIHSAEKFGFMSSTFQVLRPKHKPIIQYLWTDTPNKFRFSLPLTSHSKDQVLKIYATS
jgi:hypothetical protein